MGGKVVYSDGAFKLDPEKEEFLVKHMRDAILVSEKAATEPTEDIKFPPHERNVMVEVDLGQAEGHSATVLGSDLTLEYLVVNAEYRS